MDRSEIATTIREGNLELLRVLWCDNGNSIRTKSAYLPPRLARLTASDPTDAILGHLEHAVTITAAVQALPASFDALATEAGLAPAEDIRLVPDWTSFAESAGAPTIASVMGDMVEGESPWLHCPRHFLRRMEARLKELDLNIETGFEIEFFLLQPTGEPKTMPLPIDNGLYASSTSAHKSHLVIGDILNALWRQGVPVEQYIAEAGPGQQEISLEHCGPMQLADRVILARETIRAIAHDHGLVASFVPLLFENATGSGMHLHTSLWQNGRSALPDPTAPWSLSTPAQGFMAGILAHLPALMAITTPSVNSYRRIRPHEWSGAYQAWGIANKEAALRLIPDPKTGLPIHFELKTIDAAANPYIALGSIIAAGIDGIRNALQLPEPVEIDPGNLTTMERERMGIRALPSRLGTTLDYFEADSALVDAMGPEVAKVFAAVRRAEMATLQGLSLEEERLILLERY